MTTSVIGKLWLLSAVLCFTPLAVAEEYAKPHAGSYDWVVDCLDKARGRSDGECGFSIDRSSLWSLLLDGLIEAKQNGKWGFVNRTGKVVVPFQYDSAYWFTDGLAAVKQNGKWGFINREGRLVTPIQYDAVEPFFDGLALVKQNGKYGFINTAGDVAIPLQYDFAFSFEHDGSASVRLNDESFRINKQGNRLPD